MKNKICLDYIFMDLDGPILDGYMRHYTCYLDIVGKFGGEPIGHEEYWQLKRNRISRKILLEKTCFCGSYDDYMSEWYTLIEQEKYLRLDKLKPGVKRALQLAKAHCRVMVLLTMRNNEENLYQELRNNDLLDCFDTVVCARSVGDSPKYCAIKEIAYKNAVVIGDTEEDEKTAALLHVPFWAIITGVREKEFLHADVYYEELRDISWNTYYRQR